MSEKGLCECGCGGETTPAKQSDSKRGYVKGGPVRFITGHNSKIRDKHPSWKGGKTITNGYVGLMRPAHTRADVRGYVAEHILVAEKALGKPLPKGAIVHHVNGIKDDNRSANLVICPDQAYHKLLHVRQRAMEACGNPEARKCKYCKEYETDLQGSGTEHYHKECKSKANKASYARRKEAVKR